jgi:exodeoxyribonuclease 7 large subunit
VGNRILQFATQRISGNREQLAQAESLLPLAAAGAVEKARGRMRNAAAQLAGLSGRRIAPQFTRLDMTLHAITEASRNQLQKRAARLDALQTLLDALSPMATLRRGYSITRVGGHAVTSVAELPPGTTIETQLADGTVTSTVN